MTCQRCQGLMVSVPLEDAEGTTFLEPLLSWRCLLCGNMLDDTIASNRKVDQKRWGKRPHARFGKLLKSSPSD